MQKKMTLWASDWTDNYDTEKFSIGRACFLSSAPNSHQLSISPEVLQKCAGSILGCFLVADVDTDLFGRKDFTTHVPQEKIIGYAPSEQEIEFEQDDDGIVRAYARFVISKMYAGEELGIFSDTGNLQNVSVEMMVTTEDEDSDVVTEFDIFGLTVLGKDVNGSCPSANMSITRFSVEEAIEAFHNKEVITMQEDEKKLATPDEEEMAAPEQEEMAAPEEEEMATPEEEDMATPDEEQMAAPEEEEMAADEETDMSGCSSEKLADEEPTSIAEDQQEEEDLSDASEEADMAELKARCEALAAQVENNNNVIMEQERELAELRAFKEATEAAQLATDVEEVLAEVADTFGEEQLAEYRTEAMSGGYSYFDAWSNKVKAAAFSANKSSKKDTMKETLWGGVLRFAAPITVTKKNNSLWD